MFYGKYEDAKSYLDEISETALCNGLEFAKLYCREFIDENDNLNIYLEQIEQGKKSVKHYIKAAFLLYKSENYEHCARLITDCLNTFTHFVLEDQLNLLNLSDILADKVEDFKRNAKLMFFQQNFESIAQNGLKNSTVEFYVFNKAIKTVNDNSDNNKCKQGINMLKQIYEKSQISHLALLAGINIVAFSEKRGNVSDVIKILKDIIQNYEDRIDVSCFKEKLENMLISDNMKYKENSCGSISSKRKHPSQKNNVTSVVKGHMKTLYGDNLGINLPKDNEISFNDEQSMEDAISRTTNNDNYYDRTINSIDKYQLVGTVDFDIFEEQLHNANNKAAISQIKRQEKAFQRIMSLKHGKSNSQIDFDIYDEMDDNTIISNFATQYLNKIYNRNLNLAISKPLKGYNIKFKKIMDFQNPYNDTYTKEEIEKFLKKNPDNEILNFQLAYIYLNQNDFEKFREFLLKVYKINPHYETNIVTFSLGHMFLMDKDYETALYFFSINYRKCPENIYKAMLSIAKVLEKSGQYDKALITYQKFNSTFANQKKGLYKAAKINYKQGDYETAEDLFTKILRDDPLNMKATVYIGLTLLKNSPEFDEHIKNKIVSYLTKALESHELDIKYEVIIREALSELYEFSDQIDLAIKSQKAVLKLVPKDTKQILRLTKLLISAKRYSEAISIYISIVNQNPDDLNLVNKLGSLYAYLGDHRKAIKMFVIVRTKEPKNFTANYILGKIYRDKMDSVNQAINCFETILDNDDGYKAYYEVI